MGGCGTAVILMILLGITVQIGEWVQQNVEVVIAAVFLVVIAILVYYACKKVDSENKLKATKHITNKTIKSIPDGERLSTGQYLIGRDVKEGTYDILLLDGYGEIKIGRENAYENYKYTSHYLHDADNSRGYKNLSVSNGQVIEIGIGMVILLYNKRDTAENFLAKESSQGIIQRNLDTMDGWKFEIFCADILRKNGYRNVRVTSGSGDQGVDVLAERDGIKYAVQCKRFAQPVSNKAIQEVYAGMKYYNCHVGIVMTNNYFTQSAKQLASANGIILWDRDYLMGFIENSNGNHTASN